MENEHLTPDENEAFNRIEGEIKQNLLEIENHLLEATATLEETERHLEELRKENAEGEKLGIEPFDEGEIVELYKLLKDIIQKLEEHKIQLRSELKRYYEVDEKRYQNGQ